MKLFSRFAHAFLADTGSNVGQMMGHSKCVNTVDYSATRPFRVITASEDYSSGFYEGPPFKLKFTNKVNVKTIKQCKLKGALHSQCKQTNFVYILNSH